MPEAVMYDILIILFLISFLQQGQNAEQAALDNGHPITAKFLKKVK